MLRGTSVKAESGPLPGARSILHAYRVEYTTLRLHGVTYGGEGQRDVERDGEMDL